MWVGIIWAIFQHACVQICACIHFDMCMCHAQWSRGVLIINTHTAYIHTFTWFKNPIVFSSKCPTHENHTHQNLHMYIRACAFMAFKHVTFIFTWKMTPAEHSKKRQWQCDDYFDEYIGFDPWYETYAAFLPFDALLLKRTHARASFGYTSGF